MSAILELQGLTIRFGGLVAVNNLSLSVDEGEIHGLIGPNGAGKTTAFNLISGFYRRPTAGKIMLRGEDITGLTMHRRAKKGLVRTFQHSTLFHELTVLENVVIGRHLHERPSIIAAITGADRALRRRAEEKAEEILEFFGLLNRRNELAGVLTHGQQRALGMAVALAAEPTMLLLDEPFTGMNPEETVRMMELMENIKGRNITILLVEHDMRAVMGLCGRITVINFGSLLADGDPEKVRNDPSVIEAYLGKSISDAA